MLMEETVCVFGGAHVLHKSRNKLKILDTTRMSSNNFFINGAQMSGATIQNSVALATNRQRFIHSSIMFI